MKQTNIFCLTLVVAMMATSCTPPTSMPSTQTSNTTKALTQMPASTSMPLEIEVLECPDSLNLKQDEMYKITFQVLENGQPAKADIVVNFLLGDDSTRVNPRETITDEQGQVMTNVSPVWQDQQQQIIVIGAIILPQRVSASCTTLVQLSS